MEPVADFDCVLEVNVHCDACKMRMMEVLRSIAGVYSVTIDGEEGKVKVSGYVNPNILMRALTRSGTGNHAKLKYAKVNHPQARKTTNYHYDDSQYNYGSNYRNYDSSYCNTIEDPYDYRRPVLGGYSSHHYSQPMNSCCQMRRPAAPEYRNYYPPAPAPLPAARYVSSYPPTEIDQYEETMSFCSIM